MTNFKCIAMNRCNAISCHVDSANMNWGGIILEYQEKDKQEQKTSPKVANRYAASSATFLVLAFINWKIHTFNIESFTFSLGTDTHVSPSTHARDAAARDAEQNRFQVQFTPSFDHFILSNSFLLFPPFYAFPVIVSYRVSLTAVETLEDFIQRVLHGLR